MSVHELVGNTDAYDWADEFLATCKEHPGVATDRGYSCNVRVVSVKGNEGGFGATAVLAFEQGGGIDFSPGGPSGPQEATFQIQDAAEIVQEGALLTLTVAKKEAT